ncbi:MAG: sigma-70 family RNA polymerase sigma factor [Deltaproteobacteria bacterium]|nr:sigma-70 family RNA polymerase sigma factor [Deltaproteobacteria bacterium]
MKNLREKTADSSLDEMLKALEPQMKHILYRYRIPEQDAEDLLQQTLLTLLYKRHEIQKPEPWILATFRNRCIMYWRSRQSQLHQAVDTAILELFAEPGSLSQESTELSHDLEKAIARLPNRCQRILRLRYGLDYRPAEVAEALGYKPSSIRKITNRCLAALAKQLIVAGFPGAKSRAASA